MPVSEMRGVSMLLRALLAAGALCAAAAAPAQVADVRQGTNISIALSPDGSTLVVDLLGGLWRLPSSGGGAVALVPAGSGVRQPRFHRDGRRIVVQRLVAGQWDLWLYDLVTREFAALTRTPQNEREPDFAADGRSVLFAADTTGRFELWSVSLADGTLEQLTNEPGDSGFPTVSDRGELAYVNRDRGASTLRLHNGQATGTEIYRTPNLLTAPSWRPGGRVVVFDEIDAIRSTTLRMLVLADEPLVKDVTRGEDVFAARAAWQTPAEIVYTADGQIWRRGIGALTRTPVLLFAGVGLEPAQAPLVDVALDDPGPHPAAGSIGASTTRDGTLTAFAALGDLWLTGRGGTEQLTDDAFLEAFPALSPDGGTLVFVSDRAGTPDLWRVSLDDASFSQLTRDAGSPFEPRIDPAGRRVAYLETEGLGPWSRSTLKLFDLARPAAVATLASDLYDARQLRWEGSDRLALEGKWSPSSMQRERLAFDTRGGALAGAAPDDSRAPEPRAPLPEEAPHWTPLTPDAPYVIQVGRLFDGVRTGYLRHMDIHVEGQRITAVVRRGQLPLPDEVVDLRDATVFPGLVDVHVHHSASSGERLGRIWLANGVTTVREISDDVPEALERAESWASGRRLGPRLVISPTSDPQAEERDSGPIVVARYPQLTPGFAHVLEEQRELIGLRRVAAGAPLAEIALPADRPGLPLLRVSSRNRTYQDTLAIVLVSRAAVSTGLAAVTGWSPPRSLRGGAWAASVSALLSPAEQRRFAAAPDDGNAIIAPLQETLAQIVRSGGGVAVGSDAPAVAYGYGVHAELALLAGAGIPNDQVLRLASASGAMALGLDRQLGTIEAGKLADLVAVSGDPLRTIADASNVLGVVRGGVWIDRNVLLAGPAD